MRQRAAQEKAAFEAACNIPHPRECLCRECEVHAAVQATKRRPKQPALTHWSAWP